MVMILQEIKSKCVPSNEETEEDYESTKDDPVLRDRRPRVGFQSVTLMDPGIMGTPFNQHLFNFRPLLE
jgi:hypothetical protein